MLLRVVNLVNYLENGINIMALSLRAEQKNLNQLFFASEDIYVIPEYQRPYSWNYDTCDQLFYDITSAYGEGNDSEDYFVGNIIMARSQSEKTRPYIVDGQQRIITLWLFLKAFSLIHPEIKNLSRTLEVDTVLSESSTPRIESEVYEHADNDNIKTALSLSREDVEDYLKSRKSNGPLDNKICNNLVDIYSMIKEFYGNCETDSKIKGFLPYFLGHVFLLPIELDGNTIDDAQNNALTIFETINNRGQVLEDSDIFKARLYNSALGEKKQKEFIDQWTEFNNACDSLKIKVDDLFRYYYHIIRAEEGVTTNESNLREYLTHDSNSALNAKSYHRIVEDLSKILDILQWLKEKKGKSANLKIWLQLIDLYTNLYPKYAMVNYLFYKGIEDNKELETFAKLIVRYCYYRGATVQIKYEIYRINKLVAHGDIIDNYDTSDINKEKFTHMGTLRYGYALLAHYLAYPSFIIEDASFDRLINLKDVKNLPSDWNNINYDDIKNSIANIVPLDIPRKFLPLQKKVDYYSTSSLPDVKSLLTKGITYSAFKNRQKVLVALLVKFFNSEENYD